jgi:hypothetical protein
MVNDTDSTCVRNWMRAPGLGAGEAATAHSGARRSGRDSGR